MNSVSVIPVFGPALPEIVLAAGVLVLVLFGAIRGERATAFMSYAALALIAVALVLVLRLPVERVETMGGSFVIDSFAKFMKSLTLIASAGGIVLSMDFMRREG